MKRIEKGTKIRAGTPFSEFGNNVLIFVDLRPEGGIPVEPKWVRTLLAAQLNRCQILTSICVNHVKIEISRVI